MLTATMLSACGSRSAADAEIIDAAVKAALDASEVSTAVTFEVDGKYITVEDAEGMSMQQLLAQANITLYDGDLLSFDDTQVVGSNIIIHVLRQHNVTVISMSKDSSKKTTYHTVLMGGTVADAIESVGLKLDKEQTVNFRLEDALVDDMEIIISYVQTEEATEETEATEPTEEESSEEEDWSDDDWSDDDWSDDDWYDDDWSDDDWYVPETTPPETTPPETEPSRYVVSEDVYYDCDGSGHGVKVITYSDGTQEEVYF